MSANGGTAAVEPSKLAEELRRLMSLRSRSSVRDRPCPHLDHLVPEAERASRDRRYAARTALIDRGIAAIGDPAHRSAASALLGSGPDRWRTVSHRGANAAEHFGCGWDAYRRRRANGTSQLDDTLVTLAEALVRTATGQPVEGPNTPGDATPEGPERPQAGARTDAVEAEPAPQRVATVVIEPRGGPIGGPHGDAPSTAEPSRTEPSGSGHGDGHPHGDDEERVANRRRWRLLVAGGALLVIAALAAAGVAVSSEGEPGTGTEDAGSEDAGSQDPGPATSGSGSDGSASNPACQMLEWSLGAVPPGADDDLRARAAEIRAFGEELPPADVACAGLVERYHGVVLQPVAAVDAIGIGAIVVADDGSHPPVLLAHLEYWPYRQLLSLYGHEVVGVPVRRAVEGGRQVVHLTRGAIVEDAPPVSNIVFGRAWQEWLERGGVGGQMGPPVGPIRDDDSGERIQDFANGRFVIDLADPTQVRWEPIHNPASLLPPDVAGKVLVAESGTAWYVDSERIRHWLPTTNDFGCPTGVGAEAVHQVPPQAIAVLEAGEPFRCR